VIHLGGEAAAIVPLTELRRLQANAKIISKLGSPFWLSNDHLRLRKTVDATGIEPVTPRL
jgi:hypothetical protein